MLHISRPPYLTPPAVDRRQRTAVAADRPLIPLCRHVPATAARAQTIGNHGSMGKRKVRLRGATGDVRGGGGASGRRADLGAVCFLCLSLARSLLSRRGACRCGAGRRARGR
jgi:hypothetical protein